MLKRAGLVILVTCGITLSGCGGDGRKATPQATPTLSVTDTSTPTPTPTASPTGPVAEQPVLPEATKGKAGQEAFATYVVKAWAYSLATNDPSLLVRAGGKLLCQGCKEQKAALARRTKEGWAVYPFDVTIGQIRLIRTALGTTARVTFDIPETRSFFDNGAYRNTSPAHPEATFTVSMAFEKKHYRLVGFTIS